MKRIICLIFFAVAAQASGGEWAVRIGPPSAGNGGSNPVSIPPVNPVDYEFNYLSRGGLDTSVSISPGILFGTRHKASSGAYVSLGGGLVISSGGSGPGIYSGIGMNFNWLTLDFKQTFGYNFGTKNVLSPYAFRIGARWEF